MINFTSINILYNTIKVNRTIVINYIKMFTAQLIKQLINQSFKSTVKRIRTPLAIGPAVYPLGAE